GRANLRAHAGSHGRANLSAHAGAHGRANLSAHAGAHGCANLSAYTGAHGCTNAGAFAHAIPAFGGQWADHGRRQAAATAARPVVGTHGRADVRPQRGADAGTHGGANCRPSGGTDRGTHSRSDAGANAQPEYSVCRQWPDHRRPEAAHAATDPIAAGWRCDGPRQGPDGIGRCVRRSPGRCDHTDRTFGRQWANHRQRQAADAALGARHSCRTGAQRGAHARSHGRAHTGADIAARPARHWTGGGG
ncbi:MAG: hypothetical protein IIA03_11930, partial [Proteobacteria bacterium]|nr:hypothetical protein [Pseudomonadota bacterium]